MNPSPIQGIRSATSAGAYTAASSASNGSAIALAAASTPASASPPATGAMIRAQLMLRPAISLSLSLAPGALLTPVSRRRNYDRSNEVHRQQGNANAVETAAARRARRARPPRLAAHAVGPPARPARPLPARHRDRGHRPWPGAGGALERPDHRRARLFRRTALCGGRGDRRPRRAGARGALEAGRPVARRSRVRDRRHDLALQGGARSRLPRVRGAVGDRCARALRPARPDASSRQGPDQAGRPRERLLRGDPACGVYARGSPEVLRTTAGGLSPRARADERNGGAGALHQSLQPVVGGGGICPRRAGVRY